MVSTRFLVSFISSAAFAVLVGGTVAWGVDPGAPGATDSYGEPQGVQAGVSPEQAIQSLVGASTETTGEFQANGEVGRGPAANVYPKAAPGIVLVRTPGGHGTGFIIDKSGWILTNHHVIAGGLIDLSTGLRFVRIHLGKLDDFIMTLDENPLNAIVYASDPDKDLALLKLVQLPTDRELTVIPFAEKGLAPGNDCIAIGHPTRGTLWTIRSGEIAGVGQWPIDSVDTLTSGLQLTGTAKENFAHQLAIAEKRKVFISTCGINPGDSGGPLLNTDGELVGVTFGIPSGGSKEGISLDKFSYHVHLSEVRDFMNKKPSVPQLFVPQAWPAASQISHFIDGNGDQLVDRWQFSVSDGTDADGKARYKAVGIVFDLDQSTTRDFTARFNKNELKKEDFDYEFVLQTAPLTRTFYDTDDDGKIDLILTDANGDDLSDLTIQLVDGQWTRLELKDQRMIDRSLFKDERLAAFLMPILNRQPVPPISTPETDPAPPAQASQKNN